MEIRFRILFYICLSMLLIHMLNIVLAGQLLYFGIRPGDVHSLPFIFSAPWLHGSWQHLFNNLAGLTLFSALSLVRGPAFFICSSLIIITITGLLVWLFARAGATHIGASGWIFGLWSLSMAVAWFHRSFVNIVIALTVALFYGGMFYGVLPSDPYVSFESHLFGAISGVVAAYVMTRSVPNARRRFKVY